MIGKIEPINNVEIYYEVHGQGEPVLLLHGFTGSSANWEPIAKVLSKKFQLIIPDMRGHGRSTSSPDFTFRQVALDMYALLDKLNIKKFKCAGCSGGGNTLLHMSTQQPERINSMILVSATGHYPEQARAFMANGSESNLSEEHWQSLRKLHFHGDAQIRDFFKYAKSFATDYTDMNFTQKDISAILAPTLIIQGDRDYLYPLELSIELYKALPKGSLWIVPSAGHVPILGKHMGQFIETAEEFFTTNQ